MWKGAGATGSLCSRRRTPVGTEYENPPDVRRETFAAQDPGADLGMGLSPVVAALEISSLGRAGQLLAKDELLKRARKLDIKGRSRMDKSELAKAIARKQD